MDEKTGRLYCVTVMSNDTTHQSKALGFYFHIVTIPTAVRLRINLIYTYSFNPLSIYITQSIYLFTFSPLFLNNCSPSFIPCNFLSFHSLSFTSVKICQAIFGLLYSKTCLKRNLKGPKNFSAKARFPFNQGTLHTV